MNGAVREVDFFVSTNSLTMATSFNFGNVVVMQQGPTFAFTPTIRPVRSC